VRLLTLRTVLVATDLDPSSDVALDSAHRLARASGAGLHVAHVTEPADGVAGTSARAEATDADVRAALRRAGVGASHATDVKVHVLPGVPADAIRALADRLSADAIVVGPHRERSAAAGCHLGGTARAVVERASAPCLVAGAPLSIPLRRVLVPIDLSDTARGALLVALSWASGLRAGTVEDRATMLDALHVDAGGADASASTSLEHELEIVRRSAGDWAGVAVDGVMEPGRDAAEVIARRALASEADLVVLGTRGLGQSGVDGLGSVSASVVTQLRQPILLVPPAVWRLHGADA
jgi:universal stress protein E